MAARPHSSGRAAAARVADGPAAAAADEDSPEQALRLLLWAAGLSSLVEGVGDADLSRVLGERLDMRVKGLLLLAGAEAVLGGVDDELLRALRTGTSAHELEHLSAVASVVYVHPVVRSLDYRWNHYTPRLSLARGLWGNVTVRHLAHNGDEWENPEVSRLLLQGLRGLEVLEVYSCITSEWGSELLEDCLHAAPTLRELQMWHVEVTPAQAEGLAEVLVRCSRLSSVRIRTLQVDGEVMSILARGIAESASLRSLDLAVFAPPEAELPLAQAIRCSSTLDTLTLKIHAVSRKAWTFSHLGSAIEHCTSLTSLNIECYGVAGSSIVRAIQANRALQRVKLGIFVNRLGAREHSVDLLLSESTSLESVHCMGSVFQGDDLQEFAESLAVNTRLTELRLDQMEASAAGLAHLARGLERNSTLRVLSIGCKKGDYSLAPVLNALRANSSITDLHVQPQDRDTEGLEALFSALEVNTVIRSLKSSQGPRRPISALRVASALRNNSTLTNMTLWSTQVTEEGADAISEAVALNKSLRFLEINNAVGGGKRLLAQAVARGAVRNTTLTELRLHEAPAKGAVIQWVATMLKHNSSLRTLRLGDGWLLEPALSRLSLAMRSNSTLTELHTWGFGIGNEAQLRPLADALRMHKQLKTLPFVRPSAPVAAFAGLDAAVSESLHLADHWWRRRMLVQWLCSHR